jgi:hypothetical protein
MNRNLHERKAHHLVLLGQGGSGKTRVVQNIIFVAVQHIWPSESPDEPTLIVVASSNAQAENISTPEAKARAIRNASGVRVQKLVASMMRPGNKLQSLTRLWGKVRVLVIEEVSIVVAGVCYVLDYRSMCGCSKKNHCVT